MKNNSYQRKQKNRGISQICALQSRSSSNMSLLVRPKANLNSELVAASLFCINVESYITAKQHILVQSERFNLENSGNAQLCYDRAQNVCYIQVKTEPQTSSFKYKRYYIMSWGGWSAGNMFPGITYLMGPIYSKSFSA